MFFWGCITLEIPGNVGIFKNASFKEFTLPERTSRRLSDI